MHSRSNGAGSRKQPIIGQLIESMMCRCLACLAANGGPTRCRDFCEIDTLTLTKVEVKFKSRDSLKALLLVIGVLSELMQLHEIVILIQNKTFYIVFKSNILYIFFIPI